MNDKISQIVADLFGQPKAGEDDLTVKIQRFRDEIKKVAEREDALFGKFLGLLESFLAIIPDEKQRYHAAIQALSTTSKLSKDGIVNAIGNQLAELATIEKSVMPAVPGQRNELTGWDARANAIRSEITQLRERIAQLENDEKQIVTYIAARQQELEYIEKSMQHVFATIGSDIITVQNKIREFTAENTPVQPTPQPTPQTAPQPAPQPLPQAAAQDTTQPASQAAAAPVEEKEAPEQTIEVPTQPEPLDPTVQKKCPMCGGVMNFHAIDDLWMCYSCAHEESGKDGVQGQSRDRSSAAGTAGTPASDEHQERPKKSAASSKPPADKKKPCPVCRSTMFWYPDQKAWRCLACHYERRL